MTLPPPGLRIDLMSGEFFGSEPFGAYAWMREHAPAYHDEGNDLWALTRYADVKAAGTDPAVFSNAGGIRPKFPPLPMMIDFDAPEHSRAASWSARASPRAGSRRWKSTSAPCAMTRSTRSASEANATSCGTSPRRCRST